MLSSERECRLIVMKESRRLIIATTDRDSDIQTSHLLPNRKLYLTAAAKLFHAVVPNTQTFSNTLGHGHAGGE